MFPRRNVTQPSTDERERESESCLPMIHNVHFPPRAVEFSSHDSAARYRAVLTRDRLSSRDFSPTFSPASLEKRTASLNRVSAQQRSRASITLIRGDNVAMGSRAWTGIRRKRDEDSGNTPARNYPLKSQRIQGHYARACATTT